MDQNWWTRMMDQNSVIYFSCLHWCNLTTIFVKRSFVISQSKGPNHSIKVGFARNLWLWSLQLYPWFNWNNYLDRRWVHMHILMVGWIPRRVTIFRGIHPRERYRMTLIHDFSDNICSYFQQKRTAQTQKHQKNKLSFLISFLVGLIWFAEPFRVWGRCWAGTNLNTSLWKLPKDQRWNRTVGQLNRSQKQSRLL